MLARGCGRGGRWDKRIKRTGQNIGYRPLQGTASGASAAAEEIQSNPRCCSAIILSGGRRAAARERRTYGVGFSAREGNRGSGGRYFRLRRFRQLVLAAAVPGDRGEFFRSGG